MGGFQASFSKDNIKIIFLAVLKEIADFLLNIPSTETPRIQEAHITVGHIICGLVEEKLFNKNELPYQEI